MNRSRFIFDSNRRTMKCKYKKKVDILRKVKNKTYQTTQ